MNTKKQHDKKIQVERKNRTKEREYTCGVERISASCLLSFEWRSTKYIFQKHASLILVEQSSVLRYDRLGTRRSIATACPYCASDSSKSKNIEAYQM
jgi:hypothetical protein